MRTVTQGVEQILKNQPFLVEALQRKIINYSALAEELRPQVSDFVRKPIKSAAIMMALRRYRFPAGIAEKGVREHYFKQLGDITVRSNIHSFTFKNTNSLLGSHTKMLGYFSDNPNLFYAFTRGILESNLMISGAAVEVVNRFFGKQELLSHHQELSAISLQLPLGNYKAVGLYYHLLKQLAWRDIALYEVISTANEFTILVEEALVEQAFSVIKGLKA
ncbi:hypothetical protein GGR32_000521 [Mesonia hippocampi]|uniref:Uncharacterized protein n=1 Tax=Mesonia hippocampi TaxID=1628250 RepID=A0A840ETL5_9FLAO|nr:hypothetical protein [Mesonia hippocampi]MBB4118247.1 hypothetical protein [Mesonia hippocampi]